VTASSIAILHGDLPRSVRAAMLFPADQEKARVVVGWAIARQLQLPSTRTADDLVLIAKDAAAFTHLKEEVGRRETAGEAVGEVIKALFAMISTESDRKSASFEAAILVVENTVFKAGEKTSRTGLRDHLALLRPVLHLWGAWSRFERRWPSTDIEAAALVEYAEILREQLVAWDHGRNPSSKHLSGDFLRPYEGWLPQGLKLHALSLRPDDVPVRRSAGRRPKTRPAKAG
jgi:molybdopterin converting factor small subunit